jgi:hypothetical protein
MSSLRPLLLVDFDGVLNPFAAPSCPAGLMEYGLDVFPGEDPVRLNRDHAGWLRQLAGDYDLAWASACPEDLSHYCAALIGLDPMPRVPMPSPPFHPDLKVPAVNAFAGDRLVAWLDDAFDEPARAWARQRMVPTLLVDVDPSVGLTYEMVPRLTDWARSHLQSSQGSHAPLLPFLRDS